MLTSLISSVVSLLVLVLAMLAIVIIPLLVIGRCLEHFIVWLDGSLNWGEIVPNLFDVQLLVKIINS